MKGGGTLEGGQGEQVLHGNGEREEEDRRRCPHSPLSAPLSHSLENK